MTVLIAGVVTLLILILRGDLNRVEFALLVPAVALACWRPRLGAALPMMARAALPRTGPRPGVAAVVRR